MPSETDDLVALSALQHVLYCERQAALIHVERVWLEDGATMEGRILHERVDLPGGESKRGVRVARSVQLRSDRLGLYGRADAVEYREDPTTASGLRPFPVEYKRGRVKHEVADRVQLCAQALCLEEMHEVAVPEGALYYGESHRRVLVVFDPALRAATEAAARRVRALIASGMLPAATPGPKCRACSLEPVCLPHVAAAKGQAATYLASLCEAKDIE